LSAAQIFGGNGYNTAYPAEKLMRDAKIFQVGPTIYFWLLTVRKCLMVKLTFAVKIHVIAHHCGNLS